MNPLVRLAVLGVLLVPMGRPRTGQAQVDGSCLTPDNPDYVVPAGFRPETATAQQLQCYGFPPRPSGGEALATWESVMARYRYHVNPAVTIDGPRTGFLIGDAAGVASGLLTTAAASSDPPNPPGQTPYRSSPLEASESGTTRIDARLRPSKLKSPSSCAPSNSQARPTPRL
jgi:hypothetical protein